MISGASRKNLNLLLRNTVIYALLILGGFVAILPFLWGLSCSLKLPNDLFRIPPTLIPQAVTFHNYFITVEIGIVRNFFNSLLVSVSAVLIVIVLGTMAAYVLARFSFTGSSVILSFIVVCMMVPGLASLIPTYMIMSRFRMLDTYQGLIIAYTALNLPITIWIMRGFFISLPGELERAALVDGCNAYQTFFLIMAPLCKPGLTTVAIFAFLNSYNDHLIALTLLSRQVLRTIPVAIYYTLGDQGTDWGILTASAVLSVIPTLILFLILQRNFIEGLTRGAVKG